MHVPEMPPPAINTTSNSDLPSSVHGQLWVSENRPSSEQSLPSTHLQSYVLKFMLHVALLSAQLFPTAQS
jgi:hypothetical protein